MDVVRMIRLAQISIWAFLVFASICWLGRFVKNCGERPSKKEIIWWILLFFFGRMVFIWAVLVLPPLFKLPRYTLDVKSIYKMLKIDFGVTVLQMVACAGGFPKNVIEAYCEDPALGA